MDTSNKPLFFQMVAVGGLLLLATFDWPEVYFDFLRWVISAGAVVLGIRVVRLRLYWWLALAVPAFILWFPLLGITFDRSIWVWIKLVSGLAFLAAGYFVTDGPSER